MGRSSRRCRPAATPSLDDAPSEATTIGARTSPGGAVLVAPGDPGHAVLRARVTPPQPGRGDALPQRRPVLHGRAGQRLVQDHARRGAAPGGPVVQVGPGQLHHGVPTVDAQPLLDREAGSPAVGLVVEAEQEQLVDDAGREPVPAHLVAGEVLLLDEQHVAAGAGEPGGGGGAAGPGAHDDHVDVGDAFTEGHGEDPAVGRRAVFGAAPVYGAAGEADSSVAGGGVRSSWARPR